EHYGSYRHQLVASASIRFCLTQMRDVYDRRETRSQARQHVYEEQTPRDWNARIARSFGRESDCVETPPVSGAVQPPPTYRDCRNQNEQLRRDESADVSLAQKKKLLREAGIVLNPARQSFRDSAKERECA